MDMHPIVAPFVTKIRLRLSNLIGMMRERIVDTAAMNIQILPQVLHRNAGALNMPTGITNAPRGIPFKRLIFKFGFCEPQNKVILVTLVGIFFHTFAHADSQILFIMIVKNIITIQLRRIKIDIATCFVSKSFFKQCFDDFNILCNAISSRFNYIRALDIQFAAIFKERIGIKQLWRSHSFIPMRSLKIAVN